MKSVSCLVIAGLVCLAGLASPLFAAASAENPRESDHVALRALRDRVTAALNSRDIKALRSCFAEEFAFTAVNQTVITSEAEAQAFFDAMFSGKDALLTAFKTEPKADILTRFVDTDTGVCYGSSTDTYTLRSGDTVQMKVRWTATVVKQQGEWKIALAHAGTNFLDNPVLDRVQSAGKRLTLLGTLGGLAVGLLVAWRLARKRQAA